MGERELYLSRAGRFLESLSTTPACKSTVWESEPVGPSKYPFLNAVAKITTSISPAELLSSLKLFELECGRESNPPRWGPRVLDLDIIRYGSLVLQEESLTIPHPNYHVRKFVLLPMQEIDDQWIDPRFHLSISELLQYAPDMAINPTTVDW